MGGTPLTGLQQLPTVTVNHQQTKNRRLPDSRRRLLRNQHNLPVHLPMVRSWNGQADTPEMTAAITQRGLYDFAIGESDGLGVELMLVAMQVSGGDIGVLVGSAVAIFS
jgi:hypothetical protein